MEMKDLNKQQLILLAILISFITSIATGIVTVSLMQQAPASLTTPINRVVKQTVEKIVPGESKTVVVKEEDLVVDAIAKNESSVFTITKEGYDLDNKVIEIPAGKGFIVSNKDILVADSTLAPGKEAYFVKNNSGKFKAEFLLADKGGFSFLKIGAPLDEKNKLVYTLPSFGNLEKMKIGQKIILLGSSVSSFIYDGSKDMKITVTKANAGGMVIDIDGDVLGVALSSDTLSFASIQSITEALKTLTEAPKA